MKLLTFLAARFAWVPHAATAEDAEAAPVRGEARDAVVAFLHVEVCDTEVGTRDRALRKAEKHLEWLARKKGFQLIVLHSFAHLGGSSAPSRASRAWIQDLGTRLARRDWTVAITPHGWTNAWELSVLGDGIAKVWKAFEAESASNSKAAGGQASDSGETPDSCA